MIHLNRSTKDQVFVLRDGWHLIHNGRVPRVSWVDRGGALAQLGLLQSGYSVITSGGTIKHLKKTVLEGPSYPNPWPSKKFKNNCAQGHLP